MLRAVRGDVKNLGGAGDAGNAIYVPHIDGEFGCPFPFRGVNVDGSVTLYGQLIERGSLYTPISNEEFTVTLMVRSD